MPLEQLQKDREFLECTEDHNVPLPGKPEYSVHWLENQCPNKAALASIARSFVDECSEIVTHGDPPFKSTNQIVCGKYFILIKDKVVQGGGAFMPRTFNKTTIWGYQWVWVDPSERGKAGVPGVYAEVHNYFKRKFGKFVAEEPISIAMAKFMQRYDVDTYNFSVSLESSQCDKCGAVYFFGKGQAAE